MPLPPSRHRDGDDDPEAWRGRRLHSLNQEEIEHFAAQIRGAGGGEMAGLDLSWGRARVAAKGVAVIVFIMFVTQAAVVLYVGYRMEQAMAHAQDASVQALEKLRLTSSLEHGVQRRNDDRLACVITLTQEERTRFRSEGKNSWSRWCGWMTDDP